MRVRMHGGARTTEHFIADTPVRDTACVHVNVCKNQTSHTWVRAWKSMLETKGAAICESKRVTKNVTNQLLEEVTQSKTQMLLGHQT